MLVLPLADELLPLYDDTDEALSLVTTAGLRESDCVEPEGLVTVHVFEPVALATVLLSLMVGVVLTAVVLLDETLVGTDVPATEVLPEDVLPVATLPDEALLTAVELLRIDDSLLLTVLLLPTPPLIDEVPAKSLSEPVWLLEPYHTSLLLSTWIGP